MNFGIEDAGYKLELNSNCDKKSTSAPILVQNGQVSVDCMGDLMEIDFSKSSSHKTNGKTVPVPACGKCSDLSLNEVNSYLTSKPVGELSQSFPLRKISHEESGYLEMKPLNQICTMNKPSLLHSNECVADMTKSSNIASFEGKLIKNQKNYLYKPTKELNLALHEENRADRKDHLEEMRLDNTSNSENITHLSCKYSQLTVQPTSKTINDTEAERSISMVDTEKNIEATKSICHEQCSTKCILLDTMHGKNYSSKEAISSSNREKKLPLPEIIERYSVSSSVPSLPLAPLSNVSKLSSVSRLKDPPTLLTVIDKSESEIFLVNCITENITSQITTPTSSTACPSNELYYAKLDLPQCSTKDNTKFPKTENVDSPAISAENDSYAKIDFDHSSDSSSSSKTLNN